MSDALREGSQAASRLAKILRRAFDEGCPGGYGVRSLARRLGITPTLATAAVRVVRAPDPISVLSAMPGSRGRRSLVEAIRGSGLDAATIEAVVAAMASLEATLEGRGYDYETLRAFAAERSDPAAARAYGTRGRKAAFESMAHVWGARARGLVTCSVITPSEDGVHCDDVGAQFFIGLERLRPGPPMGICWPRMVARPGEAYRTEDDASSPLSGTASSPLVEELGSPDLEATEIQLHPRGAVVFGIPNAGRDGTIDVCPASRMDAIGPMRSDDPEDAAEVNMNVVLPVADLVFDLWFDRDLPRGGDPVAALYNRGLRDRDHPDDREARRVPLHETVTAPRRPLALPRPLEDVDERYGMLISRLARVHGREPRDLVCHRLHMRYPPVHGAIVLRWRLASEED